MCSMVLVDWTRPNLIIAPSPSPTSSLRLLVWCSTVSNYFILLSKKPVAVVSSESVTGMGMVENTKQHTRIHAHQMHGKQTKQRATNDSPVYCSSVQSLSDKNVFEQATKVALAKLAGRGQNLAVSRTDDRIQAKVEMRICFE